MARPRLAGRFDGILTRGIRFAGSFPVGPWRSWKRASMASRRSGVRIPPAPPILSLIIFVGFVSAEAELCFALRRNPSSLILFCLLFPRKKSKSDAGLDGIDPGIVIGNGGIRDVHEADLWAEIVAAVKHVDA